jgi:hypothetical protein
MITLYKIGGEVGASSALGKFRHSAFFFSLDLDEENRLFFLLLLKMDKLGACYLQNSFSPQDWSSWFVPQEGW